MVVEGVEALQPEESMSVAMLLHSQCLILLRSVKNLFHTAPHAGAGRCIHSHLLHGVMIFV